MVYSMSFVLHKCNEGKNGSLTATATTVKGNSADKIETDPDENRTWAQNIIKHGKKEADKQAFRDDLKANIVKFLTTVVQVAQLQKETGTEFPLPLTFGVDESVNKTTLRDQIISFFKESFSEMGIELENAKQMKFDAFMKLLIGKVLEMNDMKASDFHLQVRDYLSHDTVNKAGLNTGEAPNAAVLEREGQLKEWVETAKRGIEAMKELKKHAVTLGEAYGETYKQNPFLSGARFFQIGGRYDPKNRDLLSNNVIREFDLREIAQNALRRVLGIKHHVYMKVPHDDNERPFESVAKTFIKDILARVPVKSWQ